MNGLLFVLVWSLGLATLFGVAFGLGVSLMERADDIADRVQRVKDKYAYVGQRRVAVSHG